MAGPGGREVGRVSVRAVPDTSKFAASLHAYLERIEDRLELEIPVSLDARSVAQTEAELELLTRDREIDIEMNTQALARNVSGITGGLARWAPLIVGATIAIGALVAALPAAVGLIAAPIAAIALGFDGVKEAASGLSDEVDHLKNSLSETFERLLTPGFERLESLFPTLEAGLDRVALGVSQIFDSFSRSVTTEESIETIDRILTNIGETLSRFAEGGGVDAFVDSLLLLADAGTQASASLTPEFVALFENFNDELERMAENGDLQKGMEGIGHAILFLGYALGAVVLAGLNFMAGLERIGEAVTTFATETVPEAWAALKTQTIADFDAMIDAISVDFDELSDLAEASPKEIAGFFRKLPAELQQIGADAIEGLWEGMRGPLERLQAWLEARAEDLLGSFGFIWDMGSPSKEFRKLGKFAGEGLQLGFEDSFDGVEAAAALLASSALRAASGDSILPKDLAPTAPRPSSFYLKSGELEIVNGKAYITGVVSEELLAAPA